MRRKYLRKGFRLYPKSGGKCGRALSHTLPASVCFSKLSLEVGGVRVGRAAREVSGRA